MGPARRTSDSQVQPFRILLIDDDEDDYILTREMIEEIPGQEYILDWVSSYDEGVKHLCSNAYDAYLLDYRLGERTGIDLLREARQSGCNGPLILLTGQGRSETDLEALEAGAADFLEKGGLTPSLLQRSIRYAIAQFQAASELERKVEERTRELARANAALSEADRRKDEFLSTLGHELRNPLAPIRNALLITRMAPDDPEVARRQIDLIDRQVNILVRLVEDLLDISRITSGKLRLNMDRIVLQDVLNSALEVSQPNIEHSQLTLTKDIPEEPLMVLGDSIRLAQVFTNLLNNAAKYTPKGGAVRVEVSSSLDVLPTPPASLESWEAILLAPDPDKNTHISSSSEPVPIAMIRISDTGIGIPKDQLDHVFQLFTQVDRNMPHSEGGLGVGLALVRRLVELHGGTTTVTSEGPDQGTEFTILLPLAK